MQKERREREMHEKSVQRHWPGLESPTQLPSCRSHPTQQSTAKLKSSKPKLQGATAPTLSSSCGLYCRSILRTPLHRKNGNQAVCYIVLERQFEQNTRPGRGCWPTVLTFQHISKTCCITRSQLISLDAHLQGMKHKIMSPHHHL